MSRKLDLSQLSVPQLKAVRAILVGDVATAETKKAKQLREAEAQVKELKKEREYRTIVEDQYSLEWDADYFLAFSLEHLHITCRNLSRAMKEAEASTRIKSIVVPQIYSGDETLEGSEYVKEQLKLRKNGSGYREVDM